MKQLYNLLFSLRVFLYCIFAASLILGCANRGGGPQGGPKDIAPPIPIKSVPENGATNYKKSSVDISFDEIVLLEKAFEKVVVSPPQLKSPVVKAYGKKISIQLADSLQPNTTYTIDFSDAVVDNNEKNKLLDYYFTFSTGDEIDSLMIGGTLIDARTLNPVSGTLVGIHSNLDDSALVTLPFDRISKTNDKGQFWIKGVKKGTYKVYALGDINANFTRDNPIEGLAFLDIIITPDVTFTEHLDTVWRDSTAVDTIIKRQHPSFTASKFMLRYFQEDFVRQYLVKAERTDAHKLAFYFNAPIDSLPTLTPLNFTLEHNYLLQQSANRDTLTYWFTDSLISKIDTLSYELRYLKTDSTNHLSLQLDTLNTAVRRKVNAADKSSSRSSRTKEKEEVKRMEFIPIKSNSSATFDIYNPFVITFDQPTQVDFSKVPLVELKVDTLWQKINAKFEKNDSLGLQYAIIYSWQPEKTYRIKIDSAAFVGYYGTHTNTFETTFKVKPLESYATLFILMDKLSGNEILELLDKNEKVIRTEKATKETMFQYLNPGDYYLRLFVDENGNNRWDTGNYSEKIQPESVYYLPLKLTLRAFWEVEENWDYTALPLNEQKPQELIKTSLSNTKKQP